MSDSHHVYKITEIVVVSQKSFADAAENAVKRASNSLHGLRWFEATDFRGRIKEGEIAEFQVTMKVGFKLDEE